MKRGFILLVLVMVSLSAYFVSADTFTIASSKGEITIGGISGNHLGSFTGIPVSAPSTPISKPSPSGGGQGILVVLPIPNLTINPTSFNLPVSVGIESSGEIVLANTGVKDINTTITIINLKGIIIFNQTNFIILSNKQKILDFLINPPSTAGIYAGKILFSSSNYQTKVPIVLNIGEGQSLFDIFVTIPKAYYQINQGQNIISNISLVQKGIQKETDVAIQYTIQDFNGNILFSKIETVAVLNKKNYQEEFNTSSLPPGDYLIGVKAIYSGGTATASSTFNIKSAEQPKVNQTKPKIEQLFKKVWKNTSSFLKKTFNWISLSAQNALDKIKNVHWKNFRIVIIVFSILLGIVILYFILKLRIKSRKGKLFRKDKIWEYRKN